MKKRYMIILMIMPVLLLSMLGVHPKAAAAVPERYHIAIQYDAKETVIPERLKADKRFRSSLICVAEFIDMRRIEDKAKIGHVREIGDARVPVYPKQTTITRAVADGIRAYLKKAGYKLSDKLVQWDLKQESIPKNIGKLIIGGSIDDLEVTCWTGVFSNDYKMNLKLTVAIADGKKGKILYTEHVSVAISKTDVSFSEEQLGSQASKALREAVEKIFEGKTIAETMKKSLAQ